MKSNLTCRILNVTHLALQNLRFTGYTWHWNFFGFKRNKAGLIKSTSKSQWHSHERNGRYHSDPKCPKLGIWENGLWSFQTGGTKLERFLPKNQHTQRKLLNFENWVNGEMSKSAKIWFSRSIFYVKNYPNFSQFFTLKNINLEAHFLLLIFFDKINF